MDYNNKLYKYKFKSKLFIGGELLRQDAKRNLLANIPSKSVDISPTINSWVKQHDAIDIWYVNPITRESVWDVPPNSWIKNEIYTNVTTKTISDIPPISNIWIEKDDGKVKWYVSTDTNISTWRLPPNSWVKLVIYKNSSDRSEWKEKQDENDVWYVNKVTQEAVWVLPTNIQQHIEPTISLFVYEDFELNDYQGAGTSDNIWPIITEYYNSHRKKVSIIGKRDKTNLFSIIPNNVGTEIEPILGKGTYTAVYVITDVNSKINDNTNKYILRLYVRDNNASVRNMFDYDKVKDEFRIFQQYMAKIYFYGSLFKPSSINPLFVMEDRIPLPFDYNITKIYNTLSMRNISLLSNKQKLKFLLQNIKMLDTLASNGYIHCDYKLDNVAYENPDDMNVILIDYDITTLQQLVSTNRLIKFTNDNKVNTIFVSSTYPPMYISNNLPLTYPINVFFKLPLSIWDKYSIGGLINIINTLNIKFNFDTIKIPHELSNGKIDVLMSRHIVHFLRLNDTTYDTIPTYKELYSIFNYLNNNGFIE
jgi:hypothetical protein